MEKIFIGALSGALAVLLVAAIENAKLKKILKQCVTDGTTDTFEYKGTTYSKSKYIEIRTQKYMKTTKGELKSMIKGLQKAYDKGTLDEMQLMDLEAAKQALENK